MRLQAVIFDFDGIMVDSEPLHHQAFCSVLEKRNLPLSWEDYYARYLGFDDRDVLRMRFEEAGLALDDELMRQVVDEKAKAFVDLIRVKGVSPYPGVLELVRLLEKKLAIALCSGALASDIEPILEILHLANAFEIRVTADQVHASKPDPESYREVFRLLAAAHPGKITDPARCVAIEDTPAGILSASGAGLHVLAVGNTYPREALSGARRVVDSLEEVTMEDLEELVSG